MNFIQNKNELDYSIQYSRISCNNVIRRIRCCNFYTFTEFQQFVCMDFKFYYKVDYIIAFINAIYEFINIM